MSRLSESDIKEKEDDAAGYNEMSMDYIELIANFEKPKAKIDLITLRLPTHIRSDKDRILDGQVTWPKKSGADFFTIHDPSRSDMQFLIDEFYDVEILALEIAVDFTLKDGSNDPRRLAELHSWLKMCLFPQRHERMRRTGRRKYFDGADGTIKTDTLKTRSSHKTVYWANTSSYEQVKLYIKTKDQKKWISHHSVRLETTLSRGGCQLIGVHRVGLLPFFANDLRSYLSGFFNVSAGVKPKIKRTRTRNTTMLLEAAKLADRERARVKRNWSKYGAAWAAKHGYSTIPDTKANRLIGVALKGLRDNLIALTVPRKVADWAAWIEAQKLIYQGVGELEKAGV